MYQPPVLQQFGATPMGPGGRADWRMKRIQEMVAGQGGHSRLTLVHFSNQFGISTGQLSRLFLEVTGHRFRNFAMAHRLLEASRMLRRSRKPIKEIAADLGYGHTGDFCRCFKEVFGQTPNEYRQRACAEAAFSQDGGAPTAPRRLELE